LKINGCHQTHKPLWVSYWTIKGVIENGYSKLIFLMSIIKLWENEYNFLHLQCKLSCGTLKIGVGCKESISKLTFNGNGNPWYKGCLLIHTHLCNPFFDFPLKSSYDHSYLLLHLVISNSNWHGKGHFSKCKTRKTYKACRYT